MPELVLSDSDDAPLTTVDGTGFLDLVVGEAFKRAGVRLRLVRVPAERGLKNADAGTLDGDLNRIAGLEKEYPNLVRVPEKSMDFSFAAFSKNSALPARWEAVRQRPVGYVRGWKIYEAKMQDAPTVIAANDAAQLFRLLDLGRIEVALFSRGSGDALVRQLNIQGAVALEPPLETREMFIYLHKRHRALVPKIAKALREIKAEGLYDRLYLEKMLATEARASK